MNNYHANIEKLTLENTNFRKVLYTGAHSQLVLMCLKPNEEIGVEVHHVDQFFRLEQGQAKFILDGKETFASAHDAVIVGAETEHNVINVGSEDLKLYTIYSPANHPAGTIHKTKAEAMEAEEKEHAHQ
jgi:mannose-6-phosphate isomerase-like protein (cupin superfamily)